MKFKIIAMAFITVLLAVGIIHFLFNVPEYLEQRIQLHESFINNK